jgi:hypothetical protein
MPGPFLKCARDGGEYFVTSAGALSIRALPLAKR